MSQILDRIRQALAHEHSRRTTPGSDLVILLGRSEFYDLMLSMRGYTPVSITYKNEVRCVTCYGVDLIEVCLPKCLRVVRGCAFGAGDETRS